MSRTLAALSKNMLSQLGSALAVVSGMLVLTLLSIDFFGAEPRPYLGIITYMILPAIFVTGVALIVLGILRQRRRSPDVVFPVIDFNLRATRRGLVRFLLLLVIVVVVLATGTFKAVEFMESNTFCGAVCHTVMSPEYTAFKHSPHASVHCVDCHVGPGAGGFIGAKLNGASQLMGVVLGTYERPVPTPVHDLPSPEVTCRHCHWTGKFHGTKPRVISRFADDEPNTQTQTILLLKVGGPGPDGSQGIHWHVDPGVQIRYRSDAERSQIHEVELTLADGSVTTYLAGSTDQSGPSEWRTMSCIDCHNRPAHNFHGAGESIDEAMVRGTIARDLPFMRREAERALRAGYASHEEAAEAIPQAIAAFYRSEYPNLAAERAADIEAAGVALARIYARNVFPTMDIDWGTYPDHSSHVQSPGCFRCHAGDHASADGKVITVDCRACHSIVAWNEAEPQILELLEGRLGAVRAVP